MQIGSDKGQIRRKDQWLWQDKGSSIKLKLQKCWQKMTQTFSLKIHWNQGNLRLFWRGGRCQQGPGPCRTRWWGRWPRPCWPRPHNPLKSSAVFFKECFHYFHLLQSRVGANALLFFYYGDENGPKKLGGAAISMVIHFCSDIWRGYTPPAQNTQIHAVTYAPTLLCTCCCTGGNRTFKTITNSATCGTFACLFLVLATSNKCRLVIKRILLGARSIKYFQKISLLVIESFLFWMTS